MRRRFFKIFALFFQKQSFYNFPRGSIYLFSSRQTDMFLPVYNTNNIMFFEKTNIFQKGLSNRHVFSKGLSVRQIDLIIEQIYIIIIILILSETLILVLKHTHTNFPRVSIFSSNRYEFSRKPYLAIYKHIIFQKTPFFCMYPCLCIENKQLEGTT